jgi:hypothetical protein
VEDDDVSSILLEELLEESEIQIINAKTGKEAISKFNNTPHIDLILMDLQLPEMDGFETMDHIRKIRPDIPVIAQTAFYTLDMKTKCQVAGFNDFVAKPLALQELLEKISPFLNY